MRLTLIFSFILPLALTLPLDQTAHQLDPRGQIDGITKAAGGVVTSTLGTAGDQVAKGAGAVGNVGTSTVGTAGAQGNSILGNAGAIVDEEGDDALQGDDGKGGVAGVENTVTNVGGKAFDVVS